MIMRARCSMSYSFLCTMNVSLPRDVLQFEDIEYEYGPPILYKSSHLCHGRPSSQMDFIVEAVTADPGFVWTANVMVDLDPLMPAVPASMLKNISDMELKGYWEEKEAEFPVSSVRREASVSLSLKIEFIIIPKDRIKIIPKDRIYNYC